MKIIKNPVKNMKKIKNKITTHSPRNHINGFRPFSIKKANVYNFVL